MMFCDFKYSDVNEEGIDILKMLDIDMDYFSDEEKIEENKRMIEILEFIENFKDKEKKGDDKNEKK